VSKAIQINRSLFSSEVLQCEIPVVVELHANGCAPCRKLEPIVDRLADEFDGRVKFVKVNTAEEPALGDYFDASDLPALALVCHSKDEGLYLGELEENEIRTHLQRWVEDGAAK